MARKDEVSHIYTLISCAAHGASECGKSIAGCNSRTRPLFSFEWGRDWLSHDYNYIIIIFWQRY